MTHSSGGKMTAEKLFNAVSFTDNGPSGNRPKGSDDNSVVFINLRSVLVFMAGMTAVIICSVALFNIVASRFVTPPADTEPLAYAAPATLEPVGQASFSETVAVQAHSNRRDVAKHVTKKKHKRRRHQAKKKRKHHRGKDNAMRDKQDAPDSALVNNFDSWRDIEPEDHDSSGERGRRKQCVSPQCRWLSRYLTPKLDWTVKPCHDFYAHVCSSKWFEPSPVAEASNLGSLDFRTQAVARLMNDMAAYLRDKVSATPWERNAATFFTDCLKPKMPRTLSSLRPRFPIWPLEKITSLSTLPKLVAYVSKFFRATPLLKTYVGVLHTPTHNDTLYVESPVLPLARYQLLYPNAKEEDYVRLIRSTLKGRRGSQVPRAIVKLELALSRIISRDFVTLADRAVDTANLLTGDEFWDSLLMALVGNRRQVRALDHKYLMNLMTVLRNASSPLDVANLVIYSTLTQIAPLIQNMSSLTPLGLEQTVRGVPMQVQGCLSLTEKAFPRGMRVLALKALGITEWSSEKPKARIIHNLIADIKKSLKKYVRTWFTETDSRRDAMKRLKKLKVDLLGATPHDELTYARNEKYFNKPRQVVASLLGETPERDSFSGEDFFPGSIFSPEPKYVAETHTLYLPPALFGLVNKVQHFDDPLLLLPLIGAPVLKALLSVIDGRGTQTLLGNSAVATHWWAPVDDTKLSKIRACYRDLYALSLKDMLLNSNQQNFFEEFVAQSALLDPLYKMFKEKVAKYHPDGLRLEPEFTADMLFYIVYTMGMCEPRGIERYKVRHKMGIPSRILVNAHLGSSERFTRAFKCKHSDEMTPLHLCSYWEEQH